jgi:alkylation response protein AidB-like acyl-CoA dehydrogenase
MFMADVKTPGITIKPILDSDGYPYFADITFDNVRLPKENMIGPKNEGWTVITTTLNNERNFFDIVGALRRILELIIRYAKETKRDGKPLVRDPVIRHKLAQLAIEVEITRLLYYRVVWFRDQGITLIHETSLAKVFGNETMKHMVNTGMEIMGLHGQLKPGSKWASFAAKMQHAYLVNPAWAIGGGSSEIEKNIIAWMGLKVPKYEA